MLPRYAFEEVFKSKLFVGFLALCFALPFAGLLIIYLHHNLERAAAMRLRWRRSTRRSRSTAPSSRAGCWIAGRLGFLIALFVGPALVAPDLRNNGLPLYLSRPFSRTEYVLGKMSVLLPSCSR